MLDLLVDLGDDQYLAELTGHTITPENFLGIEINPRAAAIAQLVLWIGYLQWHFRVNGADRPPPEPILRDIRTIENRDALIAYDERVLERDAAGAPVTRWDGETMKPHPVTGKPVPDEAAQAEVIRYVKPRAAAWPKADFIVGNPPFIGNKRMRERLSDGYFDALRTVFRAFPGDIDFVIYWWLKAARLVADGEVRSSGLITTNSLRQSAGQAAITGAMDDAKPISITFAVADHPWRDVETDAAVRVAMTVIRAGKLGGLLIAVADDATAHVVSESRGLINPDLTTGVAAAALDPLESNRDMCYMGVKLAGDGFRLTRDERDVLVARGVPPVLIPRLVAGSDITRRSQHRFVIDVYGMSEAQLREEQPILYQHLGQSVRPERQQLKRKSYRDLWWIFAEPRPNMRRALRGLRRAIATSEVSKHATFVFFDLEETQFDGSAIVISHDDALVLGWLSSTPHALWKLRTGGRMGVGNDPRYQSFRVFDPFPFPADASEPLQARIRAEAEALDVLRKRVLAEHADLTLTKLYNVLEALREDRTLTPQERDIHDRGLVTLIRQHHDAIDEGVADAYGWGDEHRAGTLDEETILTRLVALNKERAAEEARGLVRYLRPEFQDPGYRAPVAGTLDLGEAAVVPVSNVIPWPATLPEQVGAVQSILAAAPAPLAAGDIARSFKGKRAATVRPVLDALAGLGMARRLNDGRYAA